MDKIISEAQGNPDYTAVVVGGGRSAQEWVQSPVSHGSRSNGSLLSLSSHLARHGIRVTVVFEKADAVLACPIQLPDWIRKSRYAMNFL